MVVKDGKRGGESSRLSRWKCFFLFSFPFFSLGLCIRRRPRLGHPALSAHQVPQFVRLDKPEEDATIGPKRPKDPTMEWKVDACARQSNDELKPHWLTHLGIQSLRPQSCGLAVTQAVLPSDRKKRWNKKTRNRTIHSFIHSFIYSIHSFVHYTFFFVVFVQHN
ncbi:hypothetical protein F4818DRAFT_65427 [Hypoxylon cercidicola]|nr:hypothetical protein F4818DRAFT_65427 [Hypoxylon cercidicola]